MTPFSEIVPRYGMVFLLPALLMIIAQTYVLIEAFTCKRSAVFRVIAVVQLVLGIWWLCALLDGLYTVDYADRARTYPFFVDAVYHAPWIAAAVIDLVEIAAGAVFLLDARRFNRMNPSQSSIKEAVDMLPVGIGFSAPDGTVILKNLRMEELCIAISGRALNDAAAFWNAVTARGEEQGDSLLVEHDGKAFRFRREAVTLEGGAYDMLLASDITERYRITADLKAKNKKLLDIRLRMRMLGEDIQQLAMSEEILKARVTVHDEVGHVLLSGKYYLDHPEDADGRSLIKLMQYTNRLLTREGEEPDDAAHDGYTEALNTAKAIGVTVSVIGEPPTDSLARELVGRAIRECATNTVKHSAGDRLDVAFSHDGGCVTAVITDGGGAPLSPIVEAGGLSLLRQSVEAAGGTMVTASKPAVTVTVILPVKN